MEIIGPSCERIWIEIRTYQFQSLDANNLIGVYANSAMSHPIGMTMTNGCVFGASAPLPISGQLRTWNLGGHRTGEGRWRLEASPVSMAVEVGIGLVAEPFETDLDIISSTSITERAPALGPSGMTFSRERPTPDGLNFALHSILAALNSGECARLMRRMAVSNNARLPEVVGERCDLQRRLVSGLGDYQSVRLIDVIALDGYHLPWRAYQRKESYFVNFESQYAGGSLIPGEALLERDGSGFEPVLLW